MNFITMFLGYLVLTGIYKFVFNATDNEVSLAGWIGIILGWLAYNEVYK